MSDKIVTDARERYEHAKDVLREQHDRMREDLRFSNPAEPEQWPDELRKQREGDPYGARPCLTLDRTNERIAQVVNESRRNKPATKVRPVDSAADIKVAAQLDGLFRHIEDASRAQIANDTAIEQAARVGCGWMRVVPVVVNEETNEQEIRIQRVVDPLSVHLDPDAQEPDGMDSMWGQIETRIGRKMFERAYPKASLNGWPSDLESRYLDDKTVVVLEDFVVVESKENCITIPGIDGQSWELTEEQYWQTAQATGVKPPVLRQYMRVKRRVKWRKLTAMEVLEETDFPASYVPLIPVIGDEVWIDGKRYLSGLVRRMRDPQRLYNYERSSYVEAVALQPKVPYVGDPRSIAGYEEFWNNANRRNYPFLPAKLVDSNGSPIPPPQRQPGPALPSAYVQGASMALDDIRGSVGMYDASVGAPSNESSGKAILARQQQGDTANFHYQDNLARAIEHRSRIILEMIPSIYDTERVARILGDDGQQSSIRIDPRMPVAAKYENGKKLIAINPAVGKYDVTVSVGPTFSSKRQEQVAALGEMINGNPQLFSMIGDAYVEAMDWPNADKIARRLKAALPPEVKASEEGDNGADIPPEILAKMEKAQQMIDQLSQALNEARDELEKVKVGESIKAAELALKAQELDLRSRESQARIMMDAAQFERSNMQPAAPVEAPETENEGEDQQPGAIAVLVAQIAELKAVVSMAMQGSAMPREAVNLTIPVTIEGKGATVKSGRIMKMPDGSYSMEAAEAPAMG
jgi:hypothetical protein